MKYFSFSEENLYPMHKLYICLYMQSIVYVLIINSLIHETGFRIKDYQYRRDLARLKCKLHTIKSNWLAAGNEPIPAFPTGLWPKPPGKNQAWEANPVRRNAPYTPSSVQVASWQCCYLETMRNVIRPNTAGGRRTFHDCTEVFRDSK